MTQASDSAARGRRPGDRRARRVAAGVPHRPVAGGADLRRARPGTGRGPGSPGGAGRGGAQTAGVRPGLPAAAERLPRRSAQRGTARRGLPPAVRHRSAADRAPVRAPVRRRHLARLGIRCAPTQATATPVLLRRLAGPELEWVMHAGPMSPWGPLAWTAAVAARATATSQSAATTYRQRYALCHPLGPLQATDPADTEGFRIEYALDELWFTSPSGRQSPTSQ
jgi:hypothetical protein